MSSSCWSDWFCFLFVFNLTSLRSQLSMPICNCTTLRCGRVIHAAVSASTTCLRSSLRNCPNFSSCSSSRQLDRIASSRPWLSLPAMHSASDFCLFTIMQYWFEWFANRICSVDCQRNWQIFGWESVKRKTHFLWYSWTVGCKLIYANFRILSWFKKIIQPKTFAFDCLLTWDTVAVYLRY